MNTEHNDIGTVNTNPLPPSSESLFIHQNIPIMIPRNVNSTNNLIPFYFYQSNFHLNIHLRLPWDSTTMYSYFSSNNK